MTTPQITTPGAPPDPLAPQPTFRATFYAYLQQLVTAFGQANTVATWMEATKTETAASAAAADTSANAADVARIAAQLAQSIAEGAANYQGDYDAGTLYAVGESVTYNGSRFIKKTTAAAGTTPVDGADWLEFGTLSTNATSGAAQTVLFSGQSVHNATCDAATVTFTFSGFAPVAKVDLVATIERVSGTFDVSDFGLSGASFDASAQDTLGESLFFKPDGTKMYLLGAQNDTVYQYTLSTAWDLASVAYDSVSLSVNSQDPTPKGLFLKPDGTKMYVCGQTTDSVHQYTLSTAWDLSTATYDSVSFSVNAQATGVEGVYFKTDGTEMYVVCQLTDRVYQYTLSTAWDLSTASYTGNSVVVDANPRDLFLSDDGLKLFVSILGDQGVQEVPLSTAWDLSTATVGQKGPLSLATSGMGISFKPDLSRCFLISSATGRPVLEALTESLPTLVFPAQLEAPTLPVLTDGKFVMSIVTSDGGTSYQTVSVTEVY